MLSKDGGDHRLEGFRVAEISPDHQWHWMNAAAQRGLPGTDHPVLASETQTALARALHGGLPVWFCPRENGSAMAVCVRPPAEVEVVGRNPLEQIFLGLSSLPVELTTRAEQAVRAFSAELGWEATTKTSNDPLIASTLEVHTSYGVVDIGVGRNGAAMSVTWAGSEEISLSDVASDAFYFAAEKDFFFESRFPYPRFELDLIGGMLRVFSPYGWLATPALPIASFDGTSFRWAWADPNIPTNPMIKQSLASYQVRDFGTQHGLPILATPELGIKQATSLDLIAVARRIVGVWHHAVIEVAPGVKVVVLFDDPTLQLPPLTPVVQQQVLGIDTPEFFDEQHKARARASYAALRGHAGF